MFFIAKNVNEILSSHQTHMGGLGHSEEVTEVDLARSLLFWPVSSSNAYQQPLPSVQLTLDFGIMQSLIGKDPGVVSSQSMPFRKSQGNLSLDPVLSHELPNETGSSSGPLPAACEVRVQPPALSNSSKNLIIVVIYETTFSWYDGTYL